MCKIEDCDRHELWGGLCLDHLKEQRKPKRRRKKIEAVEVLTTDAPVENEERTITEE